MYEKELDGSEMVQADIVVGEISTFLREHFLAML